jgi:putative ABC transport system permease protein
MKLLRKLRAIFQKDKLDAEMAEEMRAHLEMQAAENEKCGMSADAARSAAQRAFGGVEQIKERARDRRGWMWVENVCRDLGLGVRLLRKNPGFTVVAVLTLALGIGSCTAILSVVNAILLRPLDYFESDRIVMIRELTPPPSLRESVVSPRNYLEWAKQASSFASIAAYANDSVNFTGGSEPRQLSATKVTAGYFDVYGLRLVLGRHFLPAEDSSGGDHAVILSTPFWQQAFGGATDVVGRTMQLNGEASTIIGVASALPGRVDVCLPMAFTPEQTSEENRGAHWLNMAARLKSGVSVARADAELKLIARQVAQANPSHQGWSAVVVSLLDYSVRGGRTALLMLLGAVGCVLLIACANVSNLLLARAATRRREISIRTALGASRARLICQLLTESFLLAFCGGGLGVLFARWGLQAAMAGAPFRAQAIDLDGQILAFAVALSLAAGFVFGLAPAWLSTRTGVNEALKQGMRGITDGGSRRLRSSLIVGEIALTVVLLSVAGLLGRSFFTLAQADPGFVPENTTVLRLALPLKKYLLPGQQAAFADALLARVAGLPGVLAAGVTHVLPMLSNQANGFIIQGRPVPDRLPITGYFAVSPGYFPAMGVRLLRGRFFNERDDSRAAHVAIINETFARQYFAGENPLGQRLNFTNDSSQWSEVVGIVADVAENAVNRIVPCQSYEPFAQQPRPWLNVVIRLAPGNSAAAATLAGLLRPAVYAVDKDQPVGSIVALDEILAGGLARPRFTATLLAVFSVIALIIAAIGLYGVMSYNVAQRSGEFGIRLALGARPADVLGLVLAQGGKLAGLGLLLGIAATIAGARIIQSMLFQTSAHDPVTLGAITGLLALIAFVACLVPARRATKVDPMVALRCE